MTSTASARTGETPAARQKRVWDKSAPSYDKQIAFFEKIQFGGGREWLGERAHGRVLEVASVFICMARAARADGRRSVMPVDAIMLSDGKVTRERAPTRLRYARLLPLGADVVASCRKVIVRPPEFSFIVITDAGAVRQAVAPKQLG